MISLYQPYSLIIIRKGTDNSMANSSRVYRTNNIFGSPHQFKDSVDPRITDVSSKVGTNFMKYILGEAPICTIIPGEPCYLPKIKSSGDKISATKALASSYLQGSEDSKSIFSSFIKSSKEEQMRLYDFKRSYTQYMNYVNILCRTGAILLGLGNYEFGGTKLMSYDWASYRFNSSANSDGMTNKDVSFWKSLGISETAEKLATALSDAKQSIFSAIGLFQEEDEYGNTYVNEYELADAYEEIDSLMTGNNFVQFYVDSSVSSTDSMGNNTSESMIKSSFDSGSNFMKEISFISNSGGITATDDIANFAASSAEALDAGITSIIGDSTNAIGQMGTALSRLINLTSNVVKGENIVFPEIYQSSSYSKDYNITVHLTTPYGSKLAYFLNIFVPMMHLIALAVPRQATGNSTRSPFLVKAYVDGIFSCNLGIVSNLSISKTADGWNTSGLPNEVDVSLTIVDLYSSLSITPASQPQLFVNNYSLIEFLATNCGLNLADQSDLSLKASINVAATLNSFKDIDNNAAGMINESVNNTLLKFTKLTF